MHVAQSAEVAWQKICDKHLLGLTTESDIVHLLRNGIDILGHEHPVTIREIVKLREKIQKAFAKNKRKAESLSSKRILSDHPLLLSIAEMILHERSSIVSLPLLWLETLERDLREDQDASSVIARTKEALQNSLQCWREDEIRGYFHKRLVERYQTYVQKRAEEVTCQHFLHKVRNDDMPEWEKCGIRSTVTDDGQVTQHPTYFFAPHFVRTILNGLVDNARKAHQRKVRPLFVDVHVGLTQEGAVLVRVSDNVGGMPDKIRKRLFRNPVQSKTSGTFCATSGRLIRELYGGEIGVTDTNLWETTIDIVIPPELPESTVAYLEG